MSNPACIRCTRLSALICNSQGPCFKTCVSRRTPAQVGSDGASDAECTFTEHAVIVVGGGPTGLMLAGEVALAGVDVAVIERRLDQELAGRRGGGLHARTIEGPIGSSRRDSRCRSQPSPSYLSISATSLIATTTACTLAERDRANHGRLGGRATGDVLDIRHPYRYRLSRGNYNAYGAAYGYRGGYYGYPGYARDCSGYGYGPNSPCYP